MKPLHLSFSDLNGGAARAAYRIHRALIKSGVESRMRVSAKSSDDWTVAGPTSRLQKLSAMIRGPLCSRLASFQRSADHTLRSPAILPSSVFREASAESIDLINLHWINSEMMSVEQIGKLRRPVVWTLHDMWAFSGCEHYPETDRWRSGYSKINRPDMDRGFDLDRWVWNRKRKSWISPIHIITPSVWLGDCVRQSALMRDWPVTVIPYPIDTDKWSPFDRGFSRDLLGLPRDVPILLFGAAGGVKDPRKGFDLLQKALMNLTSELVGLEIAVFGQGPPERHVDLGFPVHYLGRLHDDVSLRLAYCAADLFALPSRQDNLPNTGLEAHACGIPVVAFKTQGLIDIIDHKKTGYLANPFDPEDFAKGIKWILSDETGQEALGINARQKAITTWSESGVSAKLLSVYEKVLNKSNRKLGE